MRDSHRFATRHPRGLTATTQSIPLGAVAFSTAPAPCGAASDVYDRGIHPVMIARWPGLIEPDSVSEDIWYFPDAAGLNDRLHRQQKNFSWNAGA